MKTPREILLARNRQVEPKLDAIRKTVLAKCAGETALGESPERSSLGLSFVAVKLWQELIWPCRRIWLGIATVWVVILVLNLTTGEALQMAANQTPERTPQMLAILREQRELMAQLLGPIPTAAASWPKVPGPRSEQRETVVIG